MTDITENVHAMAQRAREQVPHIATEEATKLALINPFIRDILGYDTTDLTQVVPEYIADIGNKKGEKVDYALMHDGSPIVLVEAKMTGTPLEKDLPSQLYRYFGATDSAQFGIYTDGVRWLFYSDLDKDNVMDKQPFLSLDLNNLKQESINEVARFVKSEFDPDSIKENANELKYVRLIKIRLASELQSPTSGLVKELIADLYDGLKTQRVLDRFEVYVKTALKQFIEDKVRDRLNAALRNERLADDDPNQEEPNEDAVTDDEVVAFFTLKALLYDVIDTNRLTLREMTGYSAVLIDNTIRKTVCRLRLREEELGIEIASATEGKLIWNRRPIESVEGIHIHESELEERVKQLIG